jgi:4'-phosphopantetheinyl transferase
MADTELWLVDLNTAAAALEALEAATPRLSEDVRQRLEAIGDAAARRERRLTHIALRILLEARLGPGSSYAPFVRSAAGKLSLATGEVVFSLAHAEGLALVALGDADPLGVDIERARPVRVPDSRREPIEAEAIALANGTPLAGPDRDARFLNAWVRIEAAAKAHGTGVGPVLERLRPAGTRATEPPRPRAVEGLRTIVHDVPVAEGVFAAVALAAGRKPPPLGTLPETAAGLEALLAAAQGTRR